MYNPYTGGPVDHDGSKVPNIQQTLSAFYDRRPIPPPQQMCYPMHPGGSAPPQMFSMPMSMHPPHTDQQGNPQSQPLTQGVPQGVPQGHPQHPPLPGSINWSNFPPLHPNFGFLPQPPLDQEKLKQDYIRNKQRLEQLKASRLSSASPSSSSSTPNATGISTFTSQFPITSKNMTTQVSKPVPSQFQKVEVTDDAHFYKYELSDFTKKLLKGKDPANQLRLRLAAACRSFSSDRERLSSRISAILLAIETVAWTGDNNDLRYVALAQCMSCVHDSKLWKLFIRDSKLIARLSKWLHIDVKNKRYNSTLPILQFLSLMPLNQQMIDLFKLKRVLNIISNNANIEVKNTIKKITARAINFSKERDPVPTQQQQQQPPPPTATSNVIKDLPRFKKTAATTLPPAKPVNRSDVRDLKRKITSTSSTKPSSSGFFKTLSGTSNSNSTPTSNITSNISTVTARPVLKTKVLPIHSSIKSDTFKSNENKSLSKPKTNTPPVKSSSSNAPTKVWTLSGFLSKTKSSDVKPKDKQKSTSVESESESRSPSATILSASSKATEVSNPSNLSSSNSVSGILKRKNDDQTNYDSKRTKHNISIRWKPDDVLVERHEFEYFPEERSLFTGDKHSHSPGSSKEMNNAEALALKGINFTNERQTDVDMDWVDPEPINFQIIPGFLNNQTKKNSIRNGGNTKINSLEMSKQQFRESQILVALYSKLEDIPDTPSEPNLEDCGEEIKFKYMKPFGSAGIVESIKEFTIAKLNENLLNNSDNFNDLSSPINNTSNNLINNIIPGDLNSLLASLRSLAEGNSKQNSSTIKPTNSGTFL